MTDLITHRGARLGVRLLCASERAAALLARFIVPPTEHHERSR